MTFKQGADKTKQRIASVGKYLSASKKRQRITGIVVVFACVGVGQIIISSFAATTDYSPIPAVAKMQKLTEEVITLTNDYAAMPDTVANKKSAVQPNEYKVTKKQELITKVKERNEAYGLAMKYDPQTTADYYLPYGTRDKLPREAVQDLEGIRVVKGVWVASLISHQQDANNTIKEKREQYSIAITEASGADTLVYGSSLPSILSGTPVTVLGVTAGDSMVLTLPSLQNSREENTSVLNRLLWSQTVHADVITVDPNPAERICAIPEVADFLTDFLPGDGLESIAEKCYEKLGLTVERVFCDDKKECLDAANDPIDLTGEEGKRKTYILPIQFDGDAGMSVSRDELSSIYQKVAASYERMSYGKFKPAYEMHSEWVKTTANNSFDTCGEDTVGDRQAAYKKIAKDILKADQELKDRILSGNYTDVMYVYSSMQCAGVPSGMWGWAALGHSRGNSYVAESTMILSDNKEDIRARLAGVMVHELGHAYGLGHAKGACNDDEPTGDPEQIDLSKYCTAAFAEYGNNYDPMGNITDPEPTDFSFANKLRVGWVTEEDRIDVSEEGGQFTLAALNKVSGKRGIKIPYKGRDLYIDFRPNASDGLSTGLLTYFANDDRSTSLLGSRISITNGNVAWNYKSAGMRAPYRIGEGADSICVTPGSSSSESIDLKVDVGCNGVQLGDFSPAATVGREDNKFKQVWSFAENDKITLLSSGTGTCYDDKKNLLFATSQGAILVYKLKTNGLPEDNKADWVIGARKVNEVKRISGYSTPTYRAWTFAADAPEPKPAGTIGGSFQKVACDSENSRLFVSDGYGFGRIKIFSYINGLVDGMNPTAVLGQNAFNGQEVLPAGPSSVKGNVADLAYSSRYKTLIVGDTSNYRIIGFDLSKGITNNMAASWVLGQPNLSSANYDQNAIRTRQIALNDEDGKIYISGAYGDSKNYVNRIRQYGLEQLARGSQTHETEITFSGKAYPGSIVYDKKYKRLIASVGEGDSIASRQVKTYPVEGATVRNESAQSLKWTDSDDNGIPSREGSGAWSFNSVQQVIYRTCVNSNGSFVCNHYEMFKIPIPNPESRVYDELRF